MKRLTRLALAACVLLGLLSLFGPPAAWAFDEDSLIKDHAKTLAKDKDPKERASAAHWLGGRKQPAAVAALAAALSDPDATVRQAAASALWDTGKDAAAAKPELQKTLADRDAAVVARAAGALAVMDVPDAELTDAWRRAFDGARDDATAFLAARGLIGIDPPDKLAPPILTWIAKNADQAAHPPRGVSNLDYRDSAEHGAKALEHLLNQGAEPLLPLLDKTVRRTPESGKYVLGALAHAKKLPPGTVDLALEHTRSSEADTRNAAIALAGKVTAEREAAKWIPEAIRLLGDPDDSVRSSAVWALRGVKGLAHDAAPELARLVASGSGGLRESAAEALEEIGNQANPIAKADKIAVALAAKGALAAAMKDKDHDLAPAAVSAYNVLYIDTAEAVAALADAAVSGADVAARLKALQCLRNRQGQSKGVVDQIRPLTQNADKNIAEDAKTAIEWIERGGAGSPGVIKGGAAAAPAAESSASKNGHPEANAGHPERSEGSRTRNAAAPAAAEPSSPADEAAGLAALRARNLTFDEPSFNRALTQADAEAIRAYLDAGMSANHVFADENERTPLMILFFGRQACAQGADGRAIVSLLIQRGANVNAQDEKQNTPLMFAADNCDRETLRLLLKAGAKLNTKNWAGLTALSMSIVSGNPGLEELIAAGARLDAQTAKAYADAYKGNPKALALVKKASQP
jgi:HEAT repeat protein